MSSQITRRMLETWLLHHGFVRAKGKMSGHIQFESEATGAKISLPGHGPTDLTKKHLALILRSLAASGFDRRKVLEELRPER